MSEEFTGTPESEFRRSDFCGGIPVRLMDGQEWFFAEPLIRFIPSDIDMGFEVYMSLDDTDRFYRLMQNYQEMLSLTELDMAERTSDWIATEIGFGRMMLERNYDIPLEHLRRIMQFSHDAKRDPVAHEIRRQVISIINGDAPKPSAGGDEPSRMPPAE